MDKNELLKRLEDVVTFLAVHHGDPSPVREAIKMIIKDEGGAWGENVECLELKCGLKIAMEDYREIGENGKKKTEFTQGEAIDIEKKTNGKWRVPTMVEWAQIVGELGMKDGLIDRDTFVGALNLTEDHNGFGGYYWSSTVQSSSNGYYLYFDSGGLLPAYQSNRNRGFSVRLVKGGV